MSDPAPNPELMRSLGRLVRGLSALFWGLPTALLACVYTLKGDPLLSFWGLPAVVFTGLEVFGLWQLGSFQKQERVWRNALDRALVLALINFGLSPFLYWSTRMPNRFFESMLLIMAGTGLLYLAALNIVVRRLGAMLPDEALRVETRQFTALNLNLLSITVAVALLYVVLSRLPEGSLRVQVILRVLGDRPEFWLLLLLVPLLLLPLAMTLALLWKTKEVILDNVFNKTP